jgi:chromosome segregation ATPase
MAQGQTPPPREESVAAAARRAQAQRRASGKAVREYTNDNLPAAGRVAVIGEEGAYPASDATAPRPAPSAEDEKERSNADGQLKAEKDRLEALKKELEVVERQRRLDNAQLYSNPQAAETNPAGRATLAAQDQDIEARKAAIAAAQAKVTELEEKARSVNERLGPRAEEPKSPEQVRDTWSGKLRPLRDELARVESELSGMRASAGSGGLTGFAAERAQTLEQRRADLQRQIADLEDQARRAGSLPPQ